MEVRIKKFKNENRRNGYEVTGEIMRNKVKLVI